MIAKMGHLTDIDTTVLEDALAEIETLTAHLSPTVQDSVAEQFAQTFCQMPTLCLERESTGRADDIIARIQLPPRCREMLAAIRAGEINRVILV